VRGELQKLRDALAKAASDKADAEEKSQKEFERIKSDADRKIISQRKSMMFDINFYKDAC
jgi:hypothetical protein